MRRYLSLFWQYFLQYAKVRLSYRGDFFLSVATMVLATVFGLAVVFLIFGRTPRLAGWSFWEILFLYGFSLLPMALFNVLSINLYEFADVYIIQGKFDRVLVRPIHSLFQILFEKLRLEALGDLFLGFAVLAAAAARLQLRIDVLDVLLLAGAVLCGALLYTSIFISLCTVSFYMEDRVGVMPPVYNMLAFGRYPMDIYNGFIRVLLSWVIPFGFATFYPAAAFLKHDAYRIYAWLIPVVTVAFAWLALALWNRGVRSYSSTGS